MGLDTTHNAWHGSYSSFNEWRKWIAKQINIDLYSMIGFGGEGIWDMSNPLYPLLDHSDCDGEIKWGDCKAIAEGLQDILDKNPDTTVPEHYPDGYFIDKTKRFIEGCWLAYSLQENIEFG